MPKGSIPRSKSGKTWDYLKNRSNIGKPFRAVKELMDDPPSLTGPIRQKDVERSFDAAGLVSAGSMAAKRPPNSVGTGARPYKVSGAKSKVKVTQPKEGSKKFIGPSQPTKAGDKKFIGPRQPPKSGEKGFIGPTRPPKSGDKDFVGPVRPPKSGEKDFIGPVNSGKKAGMDRKAKYALGATVSGVGGAALLGYSTSDKSTAKDRKTFGSKYSGYGGKTSSASYGATKKEPSTEPKGKTETPKINTAAPTSGGANTAKDKIKRQLQGRKSEYGASKSASDKSKVAKKTAKQVVQGSAPKRDTSFQEAVRRNRSDEYLKAKLRPKKSLADLFKKR